MRLIPPKGEPTRALIPKYVKTTGRLKNGELLKTGTALKRGGEIGGVPNYQGRKGRKWLEVKKKAGKRY